MKPTTRATPSITLSPDEVRGFLKGTRSQLRRIIKPSRGWEKHSVCKPEGAADPWAVWWHYPDTDRVGHLQECPFGKPGDVVWARETFTTYRKHTTTEQAQSDEVLRRFENLLPSDNIVALAKSFPARTGETSVLYKADFGEFADSADCDLGPWRPSTNMRREFSRLTLQIVDVRVQRVQEISEEDARAEGCDFDDGEPPPGFEEASRPMAALEYKTAWISKHGTQAWTENLWVWALTLRPLEAK